MTIRHYCQPQHENWNEEFPPSLSCNKPTQFFTDNILTKAENARMCIKNFLSFFRQLPKSYLAQSHSGISDNRNSRLSHRRHQMISIYTGLLGVKKINCVYKANCLVKNFICQNFRKSKHSLLKLPILMLCNSRINRIIVDTFFSNLFMVKLADNIKYDATRSQKAI